MRASGERVMSLSPGWRRVFRLPFRTARSLARDVDEELAFHIAMREEKLRRLGMTDDRAHTDALARFGDRDRVRDECITIDRRFAREVRLMEWLESMLSDFGYGLRTLRNRPAFTIVAALTLALGIGATSAMFSLVDGILLRPLPYPRPDQLVQFRQSYPEKGLDDWTLSQENLAMYRDGAHDFQSFAGFNRRGVTLEANGRPERINAARVTADFFTVLGVPPLIGRAFTREEDTPTSNAFVILSYGFWQSHFAGDRGVLGKTLDLDGQPTRVLGVMPPQFAYPRPDVQAFLPVGLDPTRRFGWFLTGVARLRPGVTVEHAGRETTALMWNWARREPDALSMTVDPATTRMKTLVTPLRTAITGDVARPLAVLQAAVLVILLIAVANVATLMSSRASGRRREMALRTALGATSGRVVRQVLTESVALASLGGALGIALAFLLVRTFTHSAAESLPRVGEVSMSWRVLTFTFIVSIGSGLLFGLSPALHTLRHRITDGLSGQKESAHGSARRLNSTLVVAQLGLSVMLLVSAGLVLKSFRHLLNVDLGFDPSGVTAVLMPLPHERYMDDHKIAAITSQAVARVGAIPGVRAAAAAFPLPYSGGVNTDGYLIEGHAPPAVAGSETQTAQVLVTPGFFRALRIPLLYGRDFDVSDRDSSIKVVVVDDALAGRYWKGAEAIGKRMRTTGDSTWLTIVGVVGSVRDEDVASEPRPHTYFPYSQAPANRPSLAVRTTGDPSSVVTAIRKTIAEIEPGIPLDNIRPLSESISRALDNRRLTEILLATFALLAVTLAAIGIYGVMSLYVSHRHREFGIRLAVGAEPDNLVRLVLAEGMTLATGGVVIGVAGALVGTRWVRTLLYEVSPADPVVYASLAALLLAVAFASCYLPARRAAKSDPLVALRAE
jgi:predicted permease